MTCCCSPFYPTDLGSTLVMTLDPTAVDTLSFRPYRTVTSSSMFSRNSTGSSDPFNFQGDGTTSKFCVSFWIRWTGPSLPTTGALILGQNKAGTAISWDLAWGTNGTSQNLILTVGTNSAGTSTAAIQYTNFFTSPSLSVLGQWAHVLMIYDGSQSTDATKAVFYLNGTKFAGTTSGSGLVQLLGHSSSTAVLTFVGDASKANFSIRDYVLFTGVPSNNDNFAADMYNHGFGREWPDVPSSAPTLMEWFVGDDNAKSDGTFPSGPMVGKVAGYTLTDSGSPTGGMMVKEWRDVSAHGHKFILGYDPTTGYRRRAGEGDWLPTIRNGKPGVSMPAPSGGSYLPNPAYAYCAADFKTLMGASGTMGLSVIISNLGTSADLFLVSDDQTQLGTANCQQRGLGFTFINQNTILKSFGPRLMINADGYHAEGWSTTSTTYIYSSTVAGTASSNGGTTTRIQTTSEHNCTAGSQITISGVGGSVETNGSWTVSARVDSTHFDIPVPWASHAWTSGGTVAGPDWGLANWQAGIGAAAGLPNNEVFGEPAGEYLITGAVNNGSGLIQLTITGHPYQNGDKIYVGNVHGVTNANSSTGNSNNPWTVANRTTNTVDLVGSTFSGTYSATSNPPAVALAQANCEQNYPTWGGSEVVNIEFTNINDGSYGQDSTPGPYRIYRDTAQLAVAVDDGGGARIGNKWAASFEQLTCCTLNAFASVGQSSAGVWQASNGGYSAIYGPCYILASGVTNGQRARMRQWLVST